MEKLLSHRLRGFSTFEHTPSALAHACASNVPYLEIDTRVSEDGHIYVYHDARTGSDLNQRCVLAQSTAAEIEHLHFTNGEPLLSLQRALEQFQQRTFPDQILCLDIKDYGFEEQHLRLVREAGLEDHVYFVSWIPQSLMRLYERKAKTPLILSHWNLTAWGRRGSLLTALLRDKMFALGSHVIQGVNRATADLERWHHGYQHALVCQDIPEHLCSLLSASRGGLCVPRSLLSDSLASYCLHHELKLWIFSVETPSEYARYARNPAVNVVFCDDAPAIVKSIG